MFGDICKKCMILTFFVDKRAFFTFTAENYAQQGNILNNCQLSCCRFFHIWGCNGINSRLTLVISNVSNVRLSSISQIVMMSKCLLQPWFAQKCIYVTVLPNAGTNVISSIFLRLLNSAQSQAKPSKAGAAMEITSCLFVVHCLSVTHSQSVQNVHYNF